MFKQILAVTLVSASFGFSNLVLAEEDRSAVLERIKPVGSVTVAGMAAPAPEAAAPEVMAAPVESTANAAETITAVAEEVVATPSAAPAIDGKAIYMTACFACHGTGAAGAPKLGDNAAWAGRLAQGADALLNNAINGKGAMPPKGGRMDLSDADIAAAVDYMLSTIQ